MSNLVHRRRRCARIEPHSILCLEGSTPEDRCLSLFIALRWMQDPGGVMVWRAENIQACLRDFLAATASMACKRHLASSTRGLFGFCLTPSIRKPIRSIRLIRGKIEIQRTGAPLTRRRISLWLQGSLFVLPKAAILFSGGLEGPARQDWELRHRTAAKTRLEQRPMTEDPRRNAS